MATLEELAQLINMPAPSVPRPVVNPQALQADTDPRTAFLNQVAGGRAAAPQPDIGQYLQQVQQFIQAIPQAPAPPAPNTAQQIVRGIGAALTGFENPQLAAQLNQQLMSEIQAPILAQREQALRSQEILQRAGLSALGTQFEGQQRLAQRQRELEVEQPFEEAKLRRAESREEKRQNAILDREMQIAKLNQSAREETLKLQSQLKTLQEQGKYDQQTVIEIAKRSSDYIRLGIPPALATSIAEKTISGEPFTPEENNVVTTTSRLASVAERKAAVSEGGLALRARKQVSGGGGKSQRIGGQPKINETLYRDLEAKVRTAQQQGTPNATIGEELEIFKKETKGLNVKDKAAVDKLRADWKLSK